MKQQLVIESDGAEGFIAYMPDTPIVTYGTSVDEVMNNVLALVDEHNAQNLPADHLTIGDVLMEATPETDSDE